MLTELGAASDPVLLEACIAGDLAAFAKLVTRYQNLVCAVAFSTVGDRALSEDVAQETFLALWKSRELVRDSAKLQSWLCNTARNLGRNAVRGRRTEPLADEHDLASESTQFDELAERQQHAVVWAALSEISETYREPLVLYYREGESLERVADALGLSHDAVKQRVARGRAELKTQVERVQRVLVRSAPTAAFAAAIIAAIGAHAGIAHAASAATKPAVTARTTTSRLASRLVLVGVVVLALFAAAVLVLRERSAERDPSRVADPSEPRGAQLKMPSPVRAGQPPVVATERTPDAIGELRLEGVVLDQAGKPYANAIVTVTAAPPKIVRTDESGGFVVEGLLPRGYRIVARHEELVSPTLTVVLTRTTEPVILELRRGATLDVTVIDELSGRPVPRAEIEIATLDDRPRQLTDERGKVRIGALVEDAQIVTRAPGFGVATSWLSVPSDCVVFRRTIYLDAARTVSGHVRDRAGAPLAGVRVRANSAQSGHPDHAVTDATGAWTFVDLPPAAYTFDANAPGQGHARSERIDLLTADARSPVELVLARGVRIAGRVVDGTGTAVPLAAVEVLGRAATTTNGDGEFAIEDLVPGTIKLFAGRFPDASKLETLELRAGAEQTNVVLTVRPSLIRGVVTVGGEPAVGIVVSATASNLMTTMSATGEMMRSADVTNAAGEFVLGPLPDASYLVTTELDVTPVRQARPGETIELALTAKGSVTGRLVRADGGLIDTVAITLGTFEAGLAFATPQYFPTARFKIDHVTPGKHVLGIAGDGVLRQIHQDVSVVAGQTTDLGTITVEPGRLLSGRVVDPSGAPVPNALVVVSDHIQGDSNRVYWAAAGEERMSAGGSQFTRSTADGSFELTGLADKPMVAVADSRVHGRSQLIDLPGSAHELTIVVEPTGRLTGQIMNGDAPVVGAQVIARLSKRVSYMTTTDRRGHYDLARLGSGTYTLEITLDGGIGSADLRATVAIPAGKEVRHDVALAAGVALTLDLDLGKGAPLIGGVALLPGTVTASSLADLEKLGNPDDGHMQTVLGQRGKTMIVFPRMPPGTFSACFVLADGPKEPMVSCFPVAIAASPAAQTVALTPRVP